MKGILITFYVIKVQIYMYIRKVNSFSFHHKKSKSNSSFFFFECKTIHSNDQWSKYFSLATASMSTHESTYICT